jgi:hypothetical protein
LQELNEAAEKYAPAIELAAAVAEASGVEIPGLENLATAGTAVSIGAGAVSDDSWSQVKSALEFAGALAAAANPEISVPVAVGGIALQGATVVGQGLTNAENQANQSIANQFAQQAGGSYTSDDEGNPCQPGDPDCGP